MQLAQLIVNAGGVAAVVDYVGESRGNVRLPGIMMLGYVAAHSENLAMAVIVSKVGARTAATGQSALLLASFHDSLFQGQPSLPQLSLVSRQP